MKQSKYFRISLTDKCNLNCSFCNNEGQMKGRGTSASLSAQDIVWISSVASRCGYTKFKLTGGEPALHPGLLDIARGISSLGVQDLSTWAA